MRGLLVAAGSLLGPKWPFMAGIASFSSPEIVSCNKSHIYHALPMTSYAEATAVKVVDSHTYEVDLQGDWAIGSVPHGGYVTSIFLTTTLKHFTTTHASRQQPHCLSLHLEFLRRTQTGPAILSVRDMKLGGQTSTVHVSLSQLQPSDSKNPSSPLALREEVVGYITHANLNKPMTGGLDVALTLPTSWKLEPAPPKVMDFEKMLRGEDKLWEATPTDFPKFRKAHLRFETFGVRASAVASGAAYNGQGHPSFVDEWIRLAPVDGKPQRLTQTALGSVADMFPLVIESYREHLTAHGTAAQKEEVGRWPTFWCPTLLLNLDVKRVLPEEGVEWMFVRVRAKELREGRMDYEVVVMSVEGELLAISNHVVFVLGAGRNLAKRGEGKDGSKM